MIGGLPAWRRWRVARRLLRHAQRESGAPPADLLGRLRADIPHRPVVALEPDGARRRRAADRRPWLVAASLAAAAIAAVVGLRVREDLSRSQADFLEPAGAWKDAGRGGAERDATLPRTRHAIPEAPRLAAPEAASGFIPAAPAGPTSGSARMKELRLLQIRASSPAGPAPAAGAAASSPSKPKAVPQPPLVGRLADGIASGSSGNAARPAESEGQIAFAPEPAPAGGGAAGEAAESSGRLPLEPGSSDRARRPADRPPPPLAKSRAEAARQAPAPPPSGSPAGQDAATQSASRLTAEEPTVGASQTPSPSPLAARTSPPPSPPSPAAGTAWPSSSPPPPARSPAPRAALRSSFGGSTGSDFYPRLWQELLTEGRLPPPASVRVDELANAFEPSAEAAAVSRPRWIVEGAPVPPAGASHLLRFAARGLAGRPGTAAVEVEFDAAAVASARRVGASAERDGASALFLVELRPPPAKAAGESAGAASSRRAAGGDRVIATLRVSPRAVAGGADAVAALPARQVHLSELSPAWALASPALRVQGLAVQLAEALAAKDPAPRLRSLRGQARSLAAELPGEPKAAALLQLVERAAELAGAPDDSPPP